MTSRAKITAAIGVLNETATAAAAPQPSSASDCLGSSPRRSASQADSDAPMCTAGPSRPSGAPTPRETPAASAAPMPERTSMRALFIAQASMTSAMPW